MKKYLLSSIIAICLAIGSIQTASAFEWNSGGWVYNISYVDYTAELINVPAGLTELNIPATVSYPTSYGGTGVAPVTSVWLDYWMTAEQHALVTSIIIPEGVIQIRGLGNFPNLRSITIPQSVTNISGSGLSNCPLLTSIILPSHLVQLQGNVFENNIGLTSITLESDAASTQFWGAQDMFKGCVNLATVNYNIRKFTTNTNTGLFSAYSAADLAALTTFNIGAGVEDMGGINVLDNGVVYVNNYMGLDKLPNLQTINIANGAKRINLYGAKIPSISLPPSVTYVCLNECKNIQSVALPPAVEYVSLYDCDNIQSVLLPNSVANFNLGSMDNLTTVTLPENLATIPANAFSSSRLHFIELPESVSSIGNYAFYGTRGLKQIKVNWQIPLATIGNDAFDSFITDDGNGGLSKSSITLIVPRGTAGLYRAADVWQDFRIIEDGETGISELKIENEKLKISVNGNLLSFENLTGLESVQIFDVSGRTVGARLIAPLHATPATDGAQTINISHLPAGVYLVKAGNKTGKFVKK